MALTQEKIDSIKKELEGLSPEEQQKKLQEILSKLPPEEREELMGGSGGGGGEQQCPFCLMVEGKIPVRKVYEDDVCVAILDINPANPGHTLLFPKKHYQLFAQIGDREVAHLFKVANKLSVAMFESLNPIGTNILVANGPGAGQTAPHALVNIIPRFDKDEVQLAWNPKKQTDEEMDAMAAKIREKSSSIKVKEEVEVFKAPEEKREGLSDFRIP